jgi:hypothetical protein
MSAEDPTDDELEREASRDVSAAIGSPRHAPKLSAESRAINPRALLEAEARAQSGEPESEERYFAPADVGRVRRDFPDIGRRMDRLVAEHERTVARREPPMSGASPLARRRQIETEPPPPAKHEPTPTPFHPDAVAWDRYVCATLLFVQNMGVEEPEQLAVELADWLLTERRKRFG